ncbi:DUF418 domain-containing protein [Sphingomonas panacisoli]|uniref:DUF418 domain-containing protein n=1 Tax=Sphingomonas panacisoli TaxID=1813879 RepID=A0A5B8LJ53_9SPHN|nr:DUF418 domain-containing protein [Sphingomonas panacisoli]QDZ07835.1 DUF418 domain-containing protein [Sphingomonas panacisoli]
MTDAAPRLRTLDAVRGVAVMGILLLNINGLAMPDYAEIDPSHYGGATGANWWVWAIAYAVGDGKMRGLFTMMFGASTVLIAERAVANDESPVRVHYARMATLIVFGMVHAYLIWAGDILVLYALTGMIAFVGWRAKPRVLLLIGIALLGLKAADGLSAWYHLDSGRVAAARGADYAQAADWRAFERATAPSPDAAAKEVAAYRGSYADALKSRTETAIFFQTVINRIAFVDTLALMLIGMALFRWGFFSGAWSRRAYWLAAASVPVLWTCYIPLVDWLSATRWSPLTMTATEAIQLTVLRPLLSLGYAALVILFVRSGRVAWLADRLAATGRMAFSNYLGTSIVLTLFFNGYGFGWYGYLQRWQCLIVVAAMWAVMLAWSEPWLDRFAYGPFEWLWRSAARFKLQPFRRRQEIANASQ